MQAEPARVRALRGGARLRLGALLAATAAAGAVQDDAVQADAVEIGAGLGHRSQELPGADRQQR
jgi:hypothetical protein